MYIYAYMYKYQIHVHMYISIYVYMYQCVHGYVYACEYVCTSKGYASCRRPLDVDTGLLTSGLAA